MFQFLAHLRITPTADRSSATLLAGTDARGDSTIAIELQLILPVVGVFR